MNPLPGLEKLVGKQKPAKKKAPDPTLGHWAVSLYRSTFKRLPGPQARAMLIAEVERSHITQEAWQGALRAWVLNEYNPSNLDGMLRYADEHPAGEYGPAQYRRKPAPPAPPEYEPPPAAIVPKHDEWLMAVDADDEVDIEVARINDKLMRKQREWEAEWIGE